MNLGSIRWYKDAPYTSWWVGLLLLALITGCSGQSQTSENASVTDQPGVQTLTTTVHPHPTSGQTPTTAVHPHPTSGQTPATIVHLHPTSAQTPATAVHLHPTSAQTPATAVHLHPTSGQMPTTHLHPTTGHHLRPTSNPTEQPAPTSVFVAPKVPWASQIIWSAGTGETATQEVELQPGLLLVHFEHQHATPFALFLLNQAGEHLALLANHTTPVSGVRAFKIQKAGRYYLHVITGDAWRAGLVQPKTAQLGEPITPPLELAGRGSRIVGPLSLNQTALALTWSHKGALGFELQLMPLFEGPNVALVTTSGQVESTQSYTLQHTGSYLLDIGADGDWSIGIQ